MTSCPDDIRAVSTPQCNTSAGKKQVVFTGPKWCPKCREWKHRSEFYANKQNKDGLDSYCKECRKRSTRDCHRDYPGQNQKTREQDTAYKARHRAKHPDRHYARRQLLQARENGLKLNLCSWPSCAETKKIEGHHPSYKKPHEIVSLCLLHHKAADLLGDKLGFDLPIIDIGIYFKKPRRVKPTVDTPQREGVAT